MSRKPDIVPVAVERDPKTLDLPLPEYHSEGAAGMDLRAAVEEPLAIDPGAIALVPTGLKIALPHGYEAQVRPRSGLAMRHAIIVVNSPGTIDSDYRGPVNVILGNLGKEPFVVSRGDRIAQLVLAEVDRIAWREVDAMENTVRGDGGFGHTGIA